MPYNCCQQTCQGAQKIQSCDSDLLTINILTRKLNILFFCLKITKAFSRLSSETLSVVAVKM